MSIYSEFMAEIDQIQKQYDADCAKIEGKFKQAQAEISNRIDAQTERLLDERQETKEKLAALDE